MDNKDIRELAALMKEMGLTSLEYQSGGESVTLTRPAEAANAGAHGANAVHAGAQDIGETLPDNANTVKSPMVGVFYSAPGADEAPYVAVGDTVLVGDVLCIIEAMKIMNEITAERDGVISEIYVEDRQIVEFGQPLFRIGAI